MEETDGEKPGGYKFSTPLSAVPGHIKVRLLGFIQLVKYSIII